ncbi:MAG: hypothetical protein RL324_833 [Verrucomicrobiota bacterium]|jgi:hypothetical protein
MSTQTAKPFDRLDPDVRGVLIGILATLFLHLLLFWGAPRLLDLGAVGMRPATQDAEREKEPPQFTVELPPAEEEKKPPTSFKFVEVNPDAPENVPDDTANFGAQNQQVAQEKPTPDGKSDNPAIDGQEKLKSTQIVDGNRAQTQPTPQPVTPEVIEQIQQVAAAARAAANPLSGFEKFDGKAADSIGSNIAMFDPNAKAVAEKIDGVPDAADGGTSLTFRVDPQHPMVRQELADKGNRPAIFEKNVIGTKNIGPIAYNAKWSEYGAYLQKLIDAIDARWQGEIRNSKHYPNPGSEAIITFVLNSAGEVTQIKKTEGTAGDQATTWCVSAISPGVGFSYGEWTPQMMAVLGDTQELTFYFLYR